MDIFGRKRIAELERANRNLNHRLEQWEESLGVKINSIKTELAVQNRIVGRIMAKLDPSFGGDEMTPERKAASDKISEEAINRIYAEHAASNKHLGDTL